MPGKWVPCLLGGIAILSAGCGNLATAQPIDASHSSKTPSPSRTRSIHPQNFMSLHFVSQNDGWAIVENRPSATHPFLVITTKNGGRLWRVALRLSPTQSVMTQDFLSKKHAVVVVSGASASDGLVYETTNRGKSWVQSPLNITGGDLALVDFSTPQNGWIGLSTTGLSYSQTQFYHTHDGGDVWSANKSPLVGAIFPKGLTVNGPSFWVTGHNHSNRPDEVLISNDGARHWSHLVVPLPSGVTNADTYPLVVAGQNQTLPVLLYLKQGWGFNLYQKSHARFHATTTLPIHTVNPPLYAITGWQNAWVVGRDHLYRTTTGGKSWTSVYRIRSPWSVVDFLSTGVGYAIGPQRGGWPLLWRTQDGGSQWRPTPYRIQSSPVAAKH